MLIVDGYLNYWKTNYGYVKVDVEHELTDAMRGNAAILISKVNQLLNAFGEQRNITSGWRPVLVNKLIPNAALYSNHTKCLAVDLADPHGDLDAWCLANQPTLEAIGLWQEHPASTKGWCHLQCVAPRSGQRVFYP